MKKFVLLTSMLFLINAIAFANSAIDGGWTGAIGSGETAQTIQMSLKTDDAKLSGSVTGNGTELSIQEGTFDGTTLKFKALDAESGLAIQCTGSYAGDAITFACQNPAQGNATQVFTLNRVKP